MGVLVFARREEMEGTPMSPSEASTSVKAQQFPYETRFKFTGSRFFILDQHHISHTHKYQFPKHAHFFPIKIHELFPGQLMKI